MTTQPTLREILGLVAERGHSLPELDAFIDGEVRECPDGCHQGMQEDLDTGLPVICPTCHGTGEVRGPGLIVRVFDKAYGLHGDYDEGMGYVEDALRAELGTP